MTKATQDVHDSPLLERTCMAHEKRVSNQEPSLLPTKPMDLLSPQVLLRSLEPRLTPQATPALFTNFLITNGLTLPPTPPHAVALVDTFTQGKKRLFWQCCADPDLNCPAGPGQAHPWAFEQKGLR